MQTWKHYDEAKKARNANERRRQKNKENERKAKSIFSKIKKIILAILGA